VSLDPQAVIVISAGEVDTPGHYVQTSASDTLEMAKTFRIPTLQECVLSAFVQPRVRAERMHPSFRRMSWCEQWSCFAREFSGAHRLPTPDIPPAGTAGHGASRCCLAVLVRDVRHGT
jgi:hypothetical protein